jgi:hypothetical protein
MSHSGKKKERKLKSAANASFRNLKFNIYLASA